MPARSARTVSGPLTAPLTEVLTDCGVRRAEGRSGHRDCRSAPPGAPSGAMDLVCTWLTGPDAGGVQHLCWRPGPDGTTIRAVIGRAGPFRCDDPGLLAHHAVVEARAVLKPVPLEDPDMTNETDDRPTAAPTVELWVTRLAGRGGVRSATGPIRARTLVEQGVVLHLASSSCSLTVLGDDDARLGLPHQAARSATERVVVRAPRVVPDLADLAVVEHLGDALGLAGDTSAGRTRTVDRTVEIGAPERERPGGLVPTLVGLLGSTVVALVTHRPMFLLFGAMGSTVALTSWVGQWVAFGRRHRRDTDRHRAAVAHDAASRARVRAHARGTIAAVSPSLTAALHSVAALDHHLWACRRQHADAFVVALGLGDVRLAPPAGGEVSDVPVCTALGPHRRLGLTGPLADAAARSILVQLVARCGPADLRLVVVTDRPAAWRWVCRVPHAGLADASDDRATTLVDTTDGDDAVLTDVLARLSSCAAGAHVVVVTDVPDLLADPTTALRRAVDHTEIGLVVVSDRSVVPLQCTTVLTTPAQPGSTSTFVGDTSRQQAPLHLRPAGLGTARAEGVALALAHLRDPEAIVPTGALLPSGVPLESLTGPLDHVSIAARWHDPRRDQRLTAAIGATVHGDRVGPLHVDLVADGPHALVAGTTGSGKSELLRSLVIGWSLAAPPDELAIVLVDYKGGATFDALGRLPHVVGVVTDLDDHVADRMLRSLAAELRRRERVLRVHGAADLGALRRVADATADTPPRLVLVVDEFAALVAERPSFLHALVGIAQRGRSLGLHLVLATQRPTGIVSDDIRANTPLRIALRLHDRSDALDVVGDELPVALPRHRPGRAVLRDGDRCTVFQSAQCTDPARAVDEIVRAAGLAPAAGRAVPRPPWLAPLPDVLTQMPELWGVDGGASPTTGPHPAVGVLDDPDHQRLVPLHHDPSTGGLVVAGSSGGGVSSTLAAVVAASAHRYAAVFVLTSESTAGGPTGRPADPWLELDALDAAQCIDGRDLDQVLRLARRLEATGPRTTTSGARDRTLLVVDGLDRVRRILDSPAHDPRPEHRHDSWLDLVLDAALTSPTLDLVVGTADPAGVPPVVLARCASRWVHHLVDPHTAGILGIPASVVPPRVPGRIAVGGLVGQVLTPSASRSLVGARATPLDRLAPVPQVVDLDDVTSPAPDDRRDRPCSPGQRTGPRRVVVGVDLGTGSPVALTVDDGDHVMIVGSPGSGRSSAVGAIGTAVQRALGAERVAIVDDADHIDDRDGALARLAADGVVIVAAARGDALRQRSGHWSAIVRRSRTGVVLAGPQAALDGDLLGVSLPRGFPADVRPGRGWLVDHGEVSVAQLAVTDAAAAPGRRSSPNAHR